MAKSKTQGVKKLAQRNYAVDKYIRIGDRRVHLYKAGFTTVKEALDAVSAMEGEARNQADFPSDDMPFGEFVGQYIAYKSIRAKPQTVSIIHGMIRKHIAPSLGDGPVRNVMSAHNVKRWYSSYVVRADVSPARKNKVIAVVVEMIGRAWAWHLIDSRSKQDLDDAIKPVKMPTAGKDEKAYWTMDEERKFLSAIPDKTVDKVMFTLFCYLGARLGEFLGLQWKCFDPESKTISIRQQVINQRGGWVLTTELKTNESYRKDRLDDASYSALMEYMDESSHRPDDFIFPSSPSNTRVPLSRTEFRRRFNRYIQLSGVPKIVPHGVRHSKATMLASVCRNAEEVAVAAAFLGHSPSMFMGTYVSAHGTKQEDILSRIGTL